MNLEQYTYLITNLKHYVDKRELYVDNLPNDVSTFIVCNEYSDATNFMVDSLMNNLPVPLGYEINYFLYDTPKFVTEPNIVTNGKKYLVNDLKSHLAYMQEVFFDEQGNLK